MRSYYAAWFAAILFICGQANARTVQYEIDIDYGTVNYTGQDITAIKLNNGIPAPAIEATVGDILEVTFHNRLDTESSIHWHGVLLPNDQDGVPFLTTQPIAAGSSFTFRYPVIHAGTYWYHSHTGLQEQRGVYGPIIFRATTAPNHYDHELLVVWSDWIDENPQQVLRNLKRDGDYYALKKGSVQSWLKVLQHGGPAITQRLLGAWSRMGPMDISDIGYDAFLANGERAALVPEVKPGDTVLVRMINAGASTYFNVQFAGSPLTVVAADGIDVVPVTLERLRMAIAETYDVLITVPASGQYELRATANDVTGHASAFIGSGTRVPAPALPKPNLFVMDHSAMGHAAMRDDHTRQSNVQPATMEHAAMNHPAMGHSVMDHERMTPETLATGAQHHMMNTETRPAISIMHEYDRLRARQSTRLDSNKSSRVVELELTGNMERYVWSFNNQTLSEADKILIRKGENVRFVLRNATMMHHPIHLHGHFFRVLNGQGDHAPLKHTVNVPPMQTVEIEFFANEDRDWFFHCHNLYHMKAGMARVVSYEDSSRYNETIRSQIANDNAWYPSAELSLQTHMTAGEFEFANHRNGFEFEYDYNYEGEYEIDTAIRRYLSRFASVYGGGTWEQEAGEARESKAVAGLSYTLPLLIEADVRFDTEGDARLELGSTLQLSDRLNFRWQWNTDDEYRLALSFELNKRVSLLAGQDDEFDAGIGVRINY